MRFLILVTLFIGSCGLCLSTEVQESYPRVYTPLGAIEGYYNTSYSGQLYEVYKGIPYAKPPVAKLRFEVPQCIPPWDGVLIAKEFSSSCIQYDYTLGDSDYKILGSEDCLYLNVYIPSAKNNRSSENSAERSLLPVLFYIHAGSFFFGSGSLYGPRYLMDKDVVLVTINYRLGPLGFLNTEDDVVPGNMGLKDQVIALRWVKDNIESFGGDPSRITLIGQSAGGASVQYHYLTNLTTGLFQNGISFSGTAFNTWSLMKKPLEKAKKLATLVGCPIHNTRCMIDCLKSRPAHQIIQAIQYFIPLQYFPLPGWGPSVEKPGSSEFTFIDRSPIDIITSGDAQDLPWVTGLLPNEALYPLAYYIAHQEFLGILNDQWETLAPSMLSYEDTIPKSNQSELANLIKQHYLGDSAISISTFNQTVQMFTDRIFCHDSETAAKFMAQALNSSVYVYYWTYRGAHSVTETISGTTENFGVAHIDDISYAFDTYFLDPTTTETDRLMQKVLINYVVSFATNGKLNVGVEWSRLNGSLTDDEYSYLHIAGPDDISMESTYNFAEGDFWRSIRFAENIPS